MTAVATILLSLANRLWTSHPVRVTIGVPPYSLGKLVDWKQNVYCQCKVEMFIQPSLLAREIS